MKRFMMQRKMMAVTTAAILIGTKVQSSKRLLALLLFGAVLYCNAHGQVADTTKPYMSPGLQMKLETSGFPYSRYDGRNLDINLHLNAIERYHKGSGAMTWGGLGSAFLGLVLLTKGSADVALYGENAGLVVLGSVLTGGGFITFMVGRSRLNKVKFHFDRATSLYDQKYR